jgi:hypothetical protein
VAMRRPAGARAALVPASLICYMLAVASTPRPCGPGVLPDAVVAELVDALA